MSEVKTEVFFTKDNLGKNLYTKKTYYTLCIEQHVLADDKDAADDLFLENGGINHDEVTDKLAIAKNGVETTIVDADYDESGSTEYLGKVAYDKDDYFAEEDGNVIVDTDIDEDENQGDVDEDEIQPINEKALNDYVKEKAESDVDISIELENDSKLGK
jgi:hypothetical protein